MSAEETGFPRQVPMWVCSDGSKHYNEQPARWDEKQIQNMEAANAALTQGRSIADALRIFEYEGGIDPLLEHITAETKLVISHWQCQDTPGYQPQYFDKTKKLFIYGHAGSWNGPYGSWVEIRDLIRYANQTERETKVKLSDATKLPPTP